MMKFIIIIFILVIFVITIIHHSIIYDKEKQKEIDSLNNQLIDQKHLLEIIKSEYQIYKLKEKQNKKIIYKGNCTHCGAPKRIDLDYCEYCDCAYEEELQSYDDIPF